MKIVQFLLDYIEYIIGIMAIFQVPKEYLFFYLGMPLRKNFGSGRSLQSLFHFVPQRISAATLHANPDLRLIMSYEL